MGRGESASADDDLRRHTRRRFVRRLLTLYLIAYYLVIAAAVMTTWRSGLILHFDRMWTVLAITISVALGALLAVLSRR